MGFAIQFGYGAIIGLSAATAAIVGLAASNKQSSNIDLDALRDIINSTFKSEPASSSEKCPDTAAKADEVPCFNKPDNVDAAEFDKQIQEQENAINELTPDEYLNNRASYSPSNRNPYAQAKARKEYRDKMVRQYTKEFDRLGYSPKDAEAAANARIQREMKDLDATHVLDLIAGGDPDDISPDLGNKSANRSIGSQWANDVKGTGRSRVEELEEIAKKAKACNQGKMKVKLSTCK